MEYLDQWLLKCHDIVVWWMTVAIWIICHLLLTPDKVRRLTIRHPIAFYLNAGNRSKQLNITNILHSLWFLWNLLYHSWIPKHNGQWLFLFVINKITNFGGLNRRFRKNQLAIIWIIKTHRNLASEIILKVSCRNEISKLNELIIVLTNSSVEAISILINGSCIFWT